MNQEIINKFSQILDEEAKKGMVHWNLEDFKRTYPHLYVVIIKSMERVNVSNRDKDE